MKITFLGTGTSVGVPAIGCGCRVCTSPDPRDQRLRCSLWMSHGDTSWIIDTGPDLRQQCLRAGITGIDAVLLTHAHTDHITGFDDLRRFSYLRGGTLPIHGTPATLAVLRAMFGFAFDPALRTPGYLHAVAEPVSAPFLLGAVRVTALPVIHGHTEAVGYRFDLPGGTRVFYASDVKSLPQATADALDGVDLLIIDGLRHRPHPTHLCISEAVDLAATLDARRTYLTHFSCEVSHAETSATLPPDVFLAHDMLELTVP